MPHQPQRTCVACRAVRPPDQMLRVAAQNGTAPRLDESRRGKAMGRGAYLCRDLKCARTAWKRRAFERALKLQTPLDAAFQERVEALASAPITSQESQHMN